MSSGWRYVDHAKIYKCAVEAAFSLGGRSKVGLAAMLKKTRARGKDLIKRQTSLLQSDCPKKSNIQVWAPPRDNSISAIIQSFYGIERTKLTSLI